MTIGKTPDSLHSPATRVFPPTRSNPLPARRSLSPPETRERPLGRSPGEAPAKAAPAPSSRRPPQLRPRSPSRVSSHTCFRMHQAVLIQSITHHRPTRLVGLLRLGPRANRIQRAPGRGVRLHPLRDLVI